MIKTFSVRNYKALRDVTLELTPTHLLIGPNDSGKSSLLEALAALCRSVDMELSHAFVGSWSGTELVWRGATDQKVELEADFSDSPGVVRYRLVCEFVEAGRTAHVDNESAEGLESRQYEFQGIGHSRSAVSRGAVLGQKLGGADPDAVARIARSVHQELSGVHFYRWVPKHLALPVASDSKRRFRMESSGFGLAQCLDDILGYDPYRFIALQDRFRQIFPAVKSVKLLPEPAFQAPVDDPKQILMLATREGKGVHFEFQGQERPVPAAHVSDGVLLVLAYLAVLYVPQPPRLLLVEEPENGIHPGRLKEVLTILRDLVTSQSQTQVVLTTHSPYVVDLFQPHEVTLCQKGDNGEVHVRRLSESQTVRDQIDVFTLGEIWTSDGDTALMQPVGAGGAADR